MRAESVRATPALDVSFRIDLSQPGPRAAGWVPAHPPTRALTQPTLRPLAEQQPALTLVGGTRGFMAPEVMSGQGETQKLVC